MVQLLVETASDINAHVALESDGNPPTDYYTSFMQAADIGLIARELAGKLAPSAGLRNRIVHEYEAINDEIVYESINLAIDQYVEFVRQVVSFLEASD